MATEQLGPDGTPIIVPAAKGAVSVEAVGNHPVVYTGDKKAPPPAGAPTVDTVTSALHQLLNDPHTTEAVAADPASANASPEPARPAGPATASPMDAVRPEPGDNQEDVHYADLQARQVQADANDQTTKDLADRLMAQGKPSAAPQPVPTIAPQPQPAEASMIPTAAIGDIARGIVEAPDAAMSGVHAAIRNLIGFSDHLSDLVEEHVPGTIYFKGLDHIGQPGNHISIGLDTAANFAAHGVQDPRPGAAMDRAVPDSPSDHPKTVTGGLIKGFSQFATGFAAGGAALRGWKAAAGAGAVAKSFAQGALADFGAFDAHQQRLSDLVKKYAPEAENPITDYLASDPRDTEGEGRLKNALEGLGLGAGMHGLISATRYLKAARMAQRAAAISGQAEGLQGLIDAPQAVVEAQAAKFHADLAHDLGDANAKGFTIKRKFPLMAGEVAATADAGEMGPNTIGLNYAKIADTDDAQAAAVQFYDAFHSEITDAKRGVQSIDKQIQDAFGTDVSRLLGDWKPGSAMASHELTALRFAQAAAMRDFLNTARAIAAGDSSLAKQAAFLQNGHVLDALTRAVEGGKAEAARTLRTLRETIPSMTGDVSNPADAIEFYRKVDALVAGAGGKDMVERAAKAFLTVAQNNPQGTSKFVRVMGSIGKFNDQSKDVIKVFMTNGLLTAGGITKNVFGNTSALVYERMIRDIAPMGARMIGAQSHIADREGVVSQTAVLSAFQDVFRLSDHVNAGWDVMAQGRTLAKNFSAAKAKTRGFIASHREEVTTSQGAVQRLGLSGVEQGPANDSPLGRVATLVYRARRVASMSAGFVYKGVKIPGRVHGVLDDFSNIISGRAELASQAYRQAVKDADAGLIHESEIGSQMLKHQEDPSAAMLQRVIDAQQNTSWTRPPDTSQKFLTEGMKSLRKGMDSLPIPYPLGTSVFPFINTPANIFSYGVQNSVFAPLSSRFREAVMSADGATRQIALTKYAVGSLFSMYVMNHVANGDMTGSGPRDPAQKSAMMRSDPDTHASIWRPYSVRIGDNWVSVAGADPFATAYGLAADMSEAWLGNDWSDSRVATATDAFAATSMSIGNSFMNKSTMQGAAKLMDAISSYKRGDVTAPDRFVEDTVVAGMPMSAALKAARRMVDPYQRDVGSITDKFKDTIPGLSKTLPLSFDLWGRKRTYDTGMGTAYDTVIPARVSPVGAEPADREMLRLGYAKQMPSKTIGIGPGQQADLRNYPTIYNEILTRGGPPALKEVNNLVSGASPSSDYYQSLADGSDQTQAGTKAKYLADRLKFHFSQAQRSVVHDFRDDLQAISVEQSGRKAAARVSLNQ
jgi:hypothetical protein